MSYNDDKIIQVTNSLETLGDGSSRYSVFKKEGIKCSNIRKQYKKWLNLIVLQKKT